MKWSWIDINQNIIMVKYVVKELLGHEDLSTTQTCPGLIEVSRFALLKYSHNSRQSKEQSLLSEWLHLVYRVTAEEMMEYYFSI